MVMVQQKFKAENVLYNIKALTDMNEKEIIPFYKNGQTKDIQTYKEMEAVINQTLRQHI